MRQIDEHIIHCSATQPTWAKGAPTTTKIDEIRRWHTGQGWSDIGYHYVIDRDGTTLPGRPVERMGAGVRGRNEKTIHTCLIGGHGSSADDDFREHFTPAQDAALRAHIRDIDRTFGTLYLSGHNEYAAKACPGFRVRPWYKGRPEEPVDLEPDVGFSDLVAWILKLLRGGRS